jgi:hypothetical protein
LKEKIFRQQTKNSGGSAGHENHPADRISNTIRHGNICNNGYFYFCAVTIKKRCNWATFGSPFFLISQKRQTEKLNKINDI